MKTYSGKGDDGSTGSLRGGRLSKDDLLFEALGDIDEASASLTWAFNQLQHAELKDLLPPILNDLSKVMAMLAGDTHASLDVNRIRWLEEKMEELGLDMQDADGFILEWKKPASIALNISRTIIRRSERSIVRLAKKSAIAPELAGYLNRLSSFIYLLQLITEG